MSYEHLYMVKFSFEHSEGNKPVETIPVYSLMPATEHTRLELKKSPLWEEFSEPEELGRHFKNHHDWTTGVRFSRLDTSSNHAVTSHSGKVHILEEVTDAEFHKFLEAYQGK